MNALSFGETKWMTQFKDLLKGKHAVNDGKYITH